MASNSSALKMSEHRAGDEIIFKFEGNLRGEVRRVVFEGRRVRYVVTVCVECEVPERLVVGAEGVTLPEAAR